MNSYRRHALALNREAREAVAANRAAKDALARGNLRANTIRDTDADAIPRLQARIDGWERESFCLPNLGLEPLAFLDARRTLRRQIRAANRRIERLQENTP